MAPHGRARANEIPSSFGMASLVAGCAVLTACASGRANGFGADDGDTSAIVADAAAVDAHRRLPDAAGGLDGGVGLEDAAADSHGDRVACLYAQGWTAWRLRVAKTDDAGSGVDLVPEVYGLPDNSTWHARVLEHGGQGQPTFGAWIDDVNGGGVSLSGNIAVQTVISVSYSVAGLKVLNRATLTLFGRNVDDRQDGSFWIAPSLSGRAFVFAPDGSMSHVPPYKPVSIDYTGALKIDDPPAQTGMTIASSGSPSADIPLVVSVVELCIDGS